MATRTEHQVIITAREQAELVTTETEVTLPAPNEVVGRTLVTLISAGTELAGMYHASTFPRRPGYAAIFEVEAVGGEVTDMQPGDLAFCMGNHQSHQRVTREKAVRVPPGLTPERAVFTRMMAVTMSTLTTTRARPPEKMVVMGLGLVGNMGAQIFAACGYEVYAVDPEPSRRAFAVQCGIHNVLPAAPLDDPNIARKVGLVLECSGHEAAVLDGCKLARKRGEVVLVGAPWLRKTDISAHDLLHQIFFEYVDVRSGWEWELPLHPTDFRANSFYGNLAAGMTWLHEGRIQVDHLYTKMSPRDCQQAYQDLLHRRTPTLAVMFDWVGL